MGRETDAGVPVSAPPVPGLAQQFLTCKVRMISLSWGPNKFKFL